MSYGPQIDEPALSIGELRGLIDEIPDFRALLSVRQYLTHLIDDGLPAREAWERAALTRFGAFDDGGRIQHLFRGVLPRLL